MTETTLENQLKTAIQEVPDFPKQGILFKDITPVLQDSKLREAVTEAFYEYYKDSGITAVLGPESRGFLFGVPLADRLGVSFVPVRKSGKLPRKTFRQEYKLEYGTDTLEMHMDAVNDSDTVVIVDDLLASGGTAEAAGLLAERAGAKVCGFAFVVELEDLHGRILLRDKKVCSLVKY